MPLPEEARLLQMHAGKGLLLDSNLLLLLVVGSFDRSQIGRFKRLSMFAPEDFDTLVAVISQFRRLYITPNTATEVSNLAGAFSGEIRTSCFRAFAETIRACDEITVPSRDATETPVAKLFEDLGLTDAVLFRVAGDPPLVLTTDFALAQILGAHGRPVINFNHLRYRYWT